MRIDTGTYTGNDGTQPDQDISLTNCSGDCSAIATVIMCFADGDGASGSYFTTNSFDANFASKLAETTAQEAGQIIDLTTAQFTVDGNLNVQGVVYRYLVLQYDGITLDIETGQYTGNGLDNQTGVWTFGAWTPACALTQSEGARQNRWNTNDTSVGRSDSFSGIGDAGNSIQAINNGNCELGTSTLVNTLNEIYNWFILGEVADHCSFVTYNGDNNDNRNLSLLTFSSDMILIKGNGSDLAVGRQSDMVGDISFLLFDSASFANLIQAINVDGFQVGTSHTINELGQEYYAWCFKDFAGAAAGGIVPLVNAGLVNRGLINGGLIN